MKHGRGTGNRPDPDIGEAKIWEWLNQMPNKRREKLLCLTLSNLKETARAVGGPGDPGARERGAHTDAGMAVIKTSSPQLLQSQVLGEGGPFPAHWNTGHTGCSHTLGEGREDFPEGLIRHRRLRGGKVHPGASDASTTQSQGPPTFMEL